MNELKINGIYKHFKGDYYIVEGIVIHSETKEEMVLYRGLYGECISYVRPKDMFLEEQTLRLDSASIFVVDEADMTLEFGFLEDIDMICSRML